MILIMLGISLLAYVLLMNSIFVTVLVFCLFVLPLVLYYDLSKETTLKAKLMIKNKRLFYVKKKLLKLKKYCNKHNIIFLDL